MRRIHAIGLTLLLVVPGAVLRAAEPRQAGAGMDQADQAVERLRTYLQVDTINPPGNESRGVEFFARIFDAEGIEYETAESAPGRGNIWARLEGGDEPGLLLLHHMDVVPADRDYWSVDPLGAEEKDGYLYGRGALDTKTLGILHLQAFLALAHSDVPLRRDVVFMATADEEAGGFYGAGWLVENRPELFEDIGYVLNEGGDSTVQDGDVTVSVEVTQKVPLWLRLVSENEPSHGSTPHVDSSVTRLIRALDNLAGYEFEPRMVPAIDEYFRALSETADEPWEDSFANMGEAIHDRRFLTRLQLYSPSLAALTRNTCSITVLEGSNKINVVPPQAAAELDCRLLPDQDPAAFVELLGEILNDPSIRIERIMGFTPAISDSDSEVFRTIHEVTRRHYPDARVIPGVSTGFTDSHFLRDLGIDAYGYNPALMDPGEDERVHGNDERVEIEQVRAGTRIMTELVRELAEAR